MLTRDTGAKRINALEGNRSIFKIFNNFTMKNIKFYCFLFCNVVTFLSMRPVDSSDYKIDADDNKLNLKEYN